MPYHILLHTTFQNQSCLQNFVTEVLKHVKNKKISCEFIFNFLGILGFLDPIFSLYYAIPYTNMHTKFQKNPSMFVESRANTNVHRFHAKTASWWPFWISDFNQAWHVVLPSNMITQYENNKTHSVVTMVMKRQMCHFGGHFEFPISADLPYGMSL